MITLRSALIAASAAGLAACAAEAPEPAGAAPAPLAFVTEYTCGGLKAEIGVAEETMALRTGGREYVLAAAQTASGARYAAEGDGPETSFWSKGDNGLLVLEGVEYPECTKSGGYGEPASAQAPMPTAGKWIARGQEPGWVLTLENGKADFSYAYGQKTHTAVLPPASAVDGGYEYFEGPGGLSVTAVEKVCADVMSGLPYPETVTVSLGDETFEGCGGDPGALLTGAEWVVEDVNNGGVPDGARATLAFDAAEGRVSGRTGCNAYSAAYTVGGAGLTTGDVMSTEMACPPAVMDLEQKFVAVLGSAAGHSFDESGALVIHGADGTHILARR